MFNSVEEVVEFLLRLHGKYAMDVGFAIGVTDWEDLWEAILYLEKGLGHEPQRTIQ